MLFPISLRLFLVGVISMLAVSGLGLALVRWSLDVAPPRTPNREAGHIQALASDLSSQFDAHGDWRFVPAQPDARAVWLRSTVLRSMRTAHDLPGNEQATLADRIALTDPAGRLLAGVEPSAPLVALASIDRRRWTIRSRHGVAGYLTVALPRSPDDALTIAFLLSKQRNLAVLLAVALALSALASAIVATRIRRPLHALVDGARRLGRGEFNARIDARRRDEFGELARTFNDLGARLESATQSRRQWIADTSHELRTPLAVLKAQVEAMHDGVRPLSPEGLAPMAAQIVSLQTLVADLDQLARGDIGALSLRLQQLDLWEIARSGWDAFEDRLLGCGLTAQLLPPAEPAVGMGDGARLGQVVRNLLENSARYTAPGGRVVLSGTVEAAQLHLRLDDSSPGVSESDLARLGERFFRVEASRSRAQGGSGLGLALSRQIVEAHGGRLDFAASPLGGLRVSVRLPLGVA